MRAPTTLPPRPEMAWARSANRPSRSRAATTASAALRSLTTCADADAPPFSSASRQRARWPRCSSGEKATK